MDRENRATFILYHLVWVKESVIIVIFSNKYKPWGILKNSFLAHFKWLHESMGKVNLLRVTILS